LLGFGEGDPTTTFGITEEGEFEMNKINWKVRFKNKVWLGSFLSLIVGFAYSMLALFDVFPAVTQNLVVQMLNQVLTFLGLIGVIVDPTTAGLGDSDRAMGYEEPWED
jgi:phi LC3 family holin